VTKFGGVVRDKSSVVIAVPAGFARNFFADPKAIYVNYEALTGAGVRQPASQQDDRARLTVDSWFFGSAAARISFGALSISTRGLSTYGDVAMRLKPEAVNSRTSFLERNTYAFEAEHKPTLISPIPLGYRAVWDNREELAVVKHGDQINKMQTEVDWDPIILTADPIDRSKDEFIECHIFGSITRHSIENVIQVNMTPSKQLQLDIDLAIELFRNLVKP
jgi:hypothetical protein